MEKSNTCDPEGDTAYYKHFLDLIMVMKDPTHLVGRIKGVGNMRKLGKLKETPNRLRQNNLYKRIMIYRISVGIYRNNPPKRRIDGLK